MLHLAVTKSTQRTGDRIGPTEKLHVSD